MENHLEFLNWKHQRLLLQQQQLQQPQQQLQQQVEFNFNSCKYFLMAFFY